jgi:hypothetical protein
MKTIIIILIVTINLLLADDPYTIKAEYYSYSLFQVDHFSKGADNSAEVCKIYLEELNTNPPIANVVEDILDASFQPNSQVFQLPKWRKMDFVDQETKDIYVRIRNYTANIGNRSRRYFKLNHYTLDDPRLNFLNTTRGIQNANHNHPFYNVVIDIDNDGVKESVVKEIMRRSIVGYRTYFTNDLIVFKHELDDGNEKNMLIDSVLSKKIRFDGDSIRDLFMYKDRTYIKELFPQNSGLLIDLYISELGTDGEINHKCHIQGSYDTSKRI